MLRRFYLLSIISDLFPIFYELGKHSARFISSRLSSSSLHVRSLSWHCVAVAKPYSVLGFILFCIVVDEYIFLQSVAYSIDYFPIVVTKNCI